MRVPFVGTCTLMMRGSLKRKSRVQTRLLSPGLVEDLTSRSVLVWAWVLWARTTVRMPRPIMTTAKSWRLYVAREGALDCIALPSDLPVLPTRRSLPRVEASPCLIAHCEGTFKRKAGLRPHGGLNGHAPPASRP